MKFLVKKFAHLTHQISIQQLTDSAARGLSSPGEQAEPPPPSAWEKWEERDRQRMRSAATLAARSVSEAGVADTNSCFLFFAVWVSHFGRFADADCRGTPSYGSRTMRTVDDTAGNRWNVEQNGRRRYLGARRSQVSFTDDHWCVALYRRGGRRIRRRNLQRAAEARTSAIHWRKEKLALSRSQWLAAKIDTAAGCKFTAMVVSDFLCALWNSCHSVRLFSLLSLQCDSRRADLLRKTCFYHENDLSHFEQKIGARAVRSKS